MLDFLLWFPYPIRVVVCFGILFSVVPITGLLVFGGNWRQAIRYTKDWLKVIGFTVAAAVVFAIIIWPFMP